MHCGRSALAAIGIFGVISYSVSRRTTEVGIRVALGAQSADVLKQVLTEGARLVAIGLTFGLAGSLAATRLIATLLFGVKPTDPLTFTAVSAILASVTLVACYIPSTARHARRSHSRIEIRIIPSRK
jgi:putative ABC transport system permease protein